MYFEFPRRSHFLGRSHFRGEAIFQKTLLPLPCKECLKSFSESGSLKTHLRLIQEKSDLLVKNVPNNFLRRSHSPVPCSLFHKRKSVVPFKDSKNFNLTAADRINAPSKHFTLTVGDRELVAQNVILIVQINTHIMTVILRYCGPF